MSVSSRSKLAAVHLAFGRQRLAARQVVQGRDDAAVLQDVVVLLAQPLHQVVQPAGQDVSISARRYGKLLVIIGETETTLIVGKANLSALQHLAVLLAKGGQQHLATQVRVDRRPVDVEEVGTAGHRAVLQDVHPPSVAHVADAHVVGHHVHQQAHAALQQRLAHMVQIRLAAQLGVDARVVADVVAVHAARSGRQNRRQVQVADAQPGQVVHQRRRLREGERAVELQAVRRQRHAPPTAQLSHQSRDRRPAFQLPRFFF
jgi:hypothetical protein